MENIDNDIINLYKKLNAYILHHYDYSVEPHRDEPPQQRQEFWREEKSTSEKKAVEEDTVADEEISVVEDSECYSIAPRKSRERRSERFRCRETDGRRRSAERESRSDSSVPGLPSNFNNSVLDRLEDSFGTLLVKTINKKGLVNADVYKDANIDRRLFSKIISNEGYTPTKGTVLALAIALKLNLDETSSLLKSAGYALSHSSKSDLVVEFFISQTDGHYNIDVVNDALEHFGQPQLGSRL